MKDMSEEKERCNSMDCGHVGCYEYNQLRDKFKSLESRLKEAKEENKVWAEASKYWVVVGQRLSQAEADSRLDRENYVKLWEDYSHLMDVAGKMAVAIEAFVRKCNERTPNGFKYPDLPITYFEDKEHIKAKRALAEWDGIKEGGK